MNILENKIRELLELNFVTKRELEIERGNNKKEGIEYNKR